MKTTIIALLLAVGMASAYVDIHGSPNYVGENHTVELLFNLSAATLCRGNVDSNATYPDMSIEFEQANQTFAASLNRTFALGTHEVFIRCGNENLYGDSFRYTFTVVPEDQTPEEIEKRKPVSPPLPPQGPPQNNPSNPGDASPQISTLSNTTPKQTVQNTSNSTSQSIPRLPNSGSAKPLELPTQLTGLATATGNNWQTIVTGIVILMAAFGYWKFKR